MTNKSKNIIDKIVKKDYNNKLEEILSSKNYEEDVKNLLLDILYKVETSYKDYSTVKLRVLPQERYIQNIISIIKNKCDSIKLIKPDIRDDNQDIKKIIVDKYKKEIVCYPILTKLLYSISDIKKSENILKEDDELLNKTITNLINVGNNINTVEPLRDFNGFSWNIITKDIENLYYNLIYQDLIILNGNEFLEKWCNQNKTNIDYLDELAKRLKRQYGGKQSKEIIELLKRLSVLIAIKEQSLEVKEIYDEKTELEEELKNIEDREKYLVEISEKRKSLAKKIRRNDITLNNKELLEKEYKRRNSILKDKNKIFSVRILEKKLKEERRLIMNRIDECNYLMNPKNILEKETKLRKKLKYRNLVDLEDIEKEIYKDIILLQKIVIRCIKLKIKNATTKAELINIMYILRYFSLIPVRGEQTISQILELVESLNNIKIDFYLKANELKMINNISDNSKLNMSIFSHIFGTKIISLEDISLKIIKSKDMWYIQFFDEGITDETFKIGENFKDENIKIKVNKIIKLFNI